MSDARQYAVWPDPRSKSWAFQSWKCGRFSKAISSAIYKRSWQL